jgi:hypothetical protein
MSEIRDFVYLDVERIRSFVAQAGGGVASERTGSREHQAGGQVSAGGGLPFGLVRVGGETDYRYIRTETETKSVQDAIFEEFVLALHPLAVTEMVWADVGKLTDGQLVSARGHVKLVDYQTSLDALKLFPKVVSAYERFTRAASGPAPSGRNARPAATGGIPRAQLDTLGPLVEGLSTLVGTNLSDFVRIKVVPDLRFPAQAFIGDGARAGFRYSSALLGTLYPGGLAEAWTCVGLIHRASKEKLATPEGHETLGDMLEGLLDKMQDLEAFRQAARPPAIAITPLAVYRLLTPG